MARIWLAIRIYFIVLFQGDVARQVDELLKRRNSAAIETSGAKPQAELAARPAAAKPAPKAARSEAILRSMRRMLRAEFCVESASAPRVESATPAHDFMRAF